MKRIFDCLVIGGGPSGLTAGNYLAKAGVEFLIIDNGNYLYKRNRQNPSDIVSGLGGGGLFSDGKLSYYPSGSNLYALKTESLKIAYDETKELLHQFNIEMPTFNDGWNNVPAVEKLPNSNIANKNYQSTIISQDNLYKIGFYLYDQIGKNRFLVKHKVVGIEKENNVYKVEVDDLEYCSKTYIMTKSIIYCGGKFGSKSLHSFLDENDLIYKKYEFGIRIEVDPNDFDYQDYEQADLKLLINYPANKDIEFRTFCFCRNGDVIQGKFDEYNSFNGVSNISNQPNTNFGINLRIKNEQLFEKMKEEIIGLKESGLIVKQKISEYLINRNIHWSKEIFNLFSECLKSNFPKVCASNGYVYGPSFEYFGKYPVLNNELKLKTQDFWVCGDSTGDFRGLLPALVSGYLAAYSYVQKDKVDKRNLYELIRLKVSNTTKSKTIFTAQSKKLFYAKDVICEYVFREGAVPINPFQVFGYFLNDRVDRDLVRKGNNELISRCDELWVFGPIADGVLFEIARAYQLKMPIKFFTIGSMLREIVEITDLSKLIFEPSTHSQIGKENLIRFISNYYVKENDNGMQYNLFEK